MTIRKGAQKGNRSSFRNVIFSVRFEVLKAMFPKVEVSWDFNVWKAVPNVSTVGTAVFFRVKQSILLGLESENESIANRRNVGKYSANDTPSQPIKHECSYLLYSEY
jgi:hypothetical protein